MLNREKVMLNRECYIFLSISCPLDFVCIYRLIFNYNTIMAVEFGKCLWPLESNGGYSHLNCEKLRTEDFIVDFDQVNV